MTNTFILQSKHTKGKKKTKQQGYLKADPLEFGLELCVFYDILVGRLEIRLRKPPISFFKVGQMVIRILAKAAGRAHS